MAIEECEKEKMELREAKKELIKMQEVVDEQNEIISGVIKSITNIIEDATEEPLKNEVLRKKLN